MSVIVPKGKFNELKMSCIKKLKTQQEKDQTTDKRLLRDLTLKLFNGDKSTPSSLATDGINCLPRLTPNNLLI